MLDANELFVAGTGHIYAAPFGTAMPTSISSPLVAAWQDLGYLTEDGFRQTKNTESTDIMGWQSLTALRTVVTASTIQLSLDFMQSNEDVFKLYFGGGSFAGTVYTPPAAGSTDERSLVADVTDGTRNWRFWYAKVVVSANREVGFVKDNAAVWGVDLKVLATTAPYFGFDYTDTEFPAYPYP